MFENVRTKRSRSEASLLFFDSRWGPDVKEPLRARRGPGSGDPGSIRTNAGAGRPGPEKGTKAGRAVLQAEKKFHVEADDFEPKIGHFEATSAPFGPKMQDLGAGRPGPEKGTKAGRAVLQAEKKFHVEADDFEPKIGHFEATSVPFGPKMQDLSMEMGRFEAKTKHVETKIDRFEAKQVHFEAKRTHFQAKMKPLEA